MFFLIYIFCKSQIDYMFECPKIGTFQEDLLHVARLVPNSSQSKKEYMHGSEISSDQICKYVDIDNR